MHRVLASLVACIVTGALFYSCVSTPTEFESTESGRSSAAAPPSEASVPTPDTATPPERRAPEKTEALPIAEPPETEQGDIDSEEPIEDDSVIEGQEDDTAVNDVETAEEDTASNDVETAEEDTASNNVDAPKLWAAPTTKAPDRPNAEQRRSIAAWIRERPLRISGYGGLTPGTDRPLRDGAQNLLFRTYLHRLFADAGIEIEQRAAENAIALSVTPAFQSDESEKNVYGATMLITVLRLEVLEFEESVEPGAMTAVSTTIHGPLVLSRVSREDAYLNSLRTIDPSTVRRAIDTLRGELAAAVSERGVTYSVAPFPDRSGDDLYGVVRSLGTPGDREDVWRLYDSPERIRKEIAEALAESSYRFFLNSLTREIRFVYNEES